MAGGAGAEAAQQPHAQQPPSCGLCNVVASSEGQLAAHVEGKRHRKHVAMAEVLGVAKSGAAEEAAGDAGEELRCELCDVTAPSLTHKQLHLMCACLPSFRAADPQPALPVMPGMLLACSP